MKSVKKTKESCFHSAVSHVSQYISIHLSEHIRVSEIAREVGMNPSYLNKLFKAQTGETIVGFTHHKKTDFAKKLLVSTALPISEICAQLGYYDQSHFTRQFKKYATMTPKQYRDAAIGA